MPVKARILVVHGAGECAHEEDRPLADFVRRQLGNPAEVAYPKLDGLEQFDWHLARQELEAALANLADDGRVVAHSAGGAAILKFLSEGGTAGPINGLFLVAVPYVCRDGEWGTSDSAIENDFAARLPDCGNIRLYHSRDDEIVPVSHVHRYADKLKQAKVAIVDGYGHQFSSRPFQELADDLIR